eukprot:m.872442 g.872442  ORF g.872442 m.872442 type:complete len:1181 (-) comp23571_c0_seq6:1705-5247(-)
MPRSSWMFGELSREEAEEKVLGLGTADGTFLVRKHGEHSVLTVIYDGKPTHHKIKSPSGGGPLQINKKSYGGAASVRSLIKVLAKPCDGWPVQLLMLDETATTTASGAHSDDPFAASDAKCNDDSFGGMDSATLLERDPAAQRKHNAAKERVAAAASQDAIFEEPEEGSGGGGASTAHKKQTAGKGKALTGWRLAKAIRKAQKEAEAAGMEYDTYVAEHAPELIGSVPKTTAPPPQQPATAATPTVNSVEALRKKVEAENAQAAAALEAIQAKEAKAEAQRRADEAAQMKKDLEAQQQLLQKEEKEREKARQKEEKGREIARQEEQEQSLRAEKATAAAKDDRVTKQDGKKNAKKLKKKKDGNAVSKPTTATTDGAANVDNGLAAFGSAPIIPVEEKSATLTNTSAAVAEESVTTHAPPKASGTPVKKKKESSGFFSWFGGAKEESDDEDVPDHDLDASGKPLSRIEQLKRQNKRLKQAKRRAASAKATIVSAPTEPGAAAAVAQGSNQLVLPAEDEKSGDTPSSPPTQSPAEPEVVQFPSVARSDRNSSDDSSEDEQGSIFGAAGARPRPAAGQQQASGSSLAKGAAAGAFRDSSTAGTVEVGADVVKEIFAALSSLRSDRDELTTEVRALRQELGAVKAELGRMMSHGSMHGARSSGGGAAAVFAWHMYASETPDVYYRKLNERKTALQERARPGIHDPSEKEMWATEWRMLGAELARVSDELSGGGSGKGDDGVGGDHDVTHGSGQGGTSHPYTQLGADGSNSPPSELTGSVTTSNTMRKALQVHKHRNSQRGHSSVSGAAGKAAGGRTGDTIVSFGGRIGTLDPVGYVERYDDASKMWLPLAPLPTVRFGQGTSSLHGYFYVVAGSGATGSSLNVVERYDIATNKWEQVANCSTTRAGLGTAVVHDQLYAIGGASDALFGSVVLNSGERYHARDNTWRNITPMSYKRAGLAVVALDGQIFAIGGYDQNVKILRTVERYDPQTNSWGSVPPLNSPRARMGAAVVDGKIYVVGGYDGSTRVKSCEMYDPAKGSWESIASMAFARDSLAMCSMGGILFAAGGYDGERRLSVVERYNPASNTWCEAQQMCFPRDGLSMSRITVEVDDVVDDAGIVTDAAVENASAAVSAAKEQTSTPSSASNVPDNAKDQHDNSASSDESDADAGSPFIKSPTSAKSTLI